MRIFKNYLWCYFIFITALYIYLYPVNSIIFNEWPIFDHGNINKKQEYFLFLFLFLPIIILSGYIFSKIKFSKFHTSNLIIIKEIRLNSILLLLIVGFIIIQLTVEFDNSLSFNRKNREIEFFNTQLWVNYSTLIVSISFICIYFIKKLNYLTKFIFFIMLLLYFYLEIYQIGGRRYSFSIFMFAFSYFIKERSILFFSIKNFLIFAAIGSFALGFGLIRELIYHSSYNINFIEIIKSGISTNEFTAIGNGFYLTINSNYEEIIENYGNSLLISAFLLIPREYWTDKPLSLAHTIGAAISLPLELYINFNIFSIIIYSIISCFIYYIGRNKYGSFLYCSSFAYIIDATRSDFFGIMYFSLMLLIIYRIIVIKS